MKRGGFLKRGKPLKKKTTRATGKLKAKAWAAFSLWIRRRDALATLGSTTQARCCTCQKVYPITGPGCLHTGHFIPGRRMPLLLEPSNCAAQCYACNIHKHGDWPNYYAYMLRKYGQAEIDRLLSLRNVVMGDIKAQVWIEAIEKYTTKEATNAATGPA